MRKPLAGTLVLSLDQAVAAPLTSRKLADAGARVIKLERPEGDFARHYDTLVRGQCTHFAWLNRGKESVVADLSKAEDRRLFEAIAAKADVLVQNLKPGALAKLGLPVEDLRRRHPRLICCSISGYGEEGPYRERKAYDMLIQAESGLASVTGSPEAPARVGVSVVDICTGMNAYEAILEALIARGRTGDGADIRVSMFNSMMEWMAVPMLYTEYGMPPKRWASPIPRSPLTACSRPPTGCRSSSPSRTTGSGRRSARRCWRRPELARDPRFADNSARLANRAETDGLVASCFSALDDRAAVAHAGRGRDRVCARQRHRRHPAPPPPAPPQRRLARRGNRAAEPAGKMDRRGEPELRPAAGAGRAYAGRTARVSRGS